MNKEEIEAIEYFRKRILKTKVEYLTYIDSKKVRTLLNYIDKLQKENEELKAQRNMLLQKDLKFLTENYIHKDIIKYKIIELKKAPVVYSLTIDILEELLEELFGDENYE